MNFRENVAKVAIKFMDRPLSPLDTAIFWIEYVGRNGNILKSPAVHLQWWQLELLDVYGFIFLFMFTLVYIIYILFRKLFEYLSNILKNKEILMYKKKK